ncbi:MAG: tetraacyldisaccharide 4'-kinase [Candidatus Omnitrophica bacterium]|nr:tetraacyldisaccharide 4'-kinase [Candidatus Omnitrophota bacterium]
MRSYLYNIITGSPKEPIGFLIRWLFLLLSLLYLAGIRLRGIFFKTGLLKSYRLKASVISIGNITWGGTGKTPLVEAICRYFSEHGRRVSLLTRGYGEDENRVLSENMDKVSVLAGGDRVKNALKKETESDVGLFVLDDGFQHAKIKRDLDIVTINATDPFGTGFVIPGGILREPISSLKRADIAVITKTNLVTKEEADIVKNKVLKVNPDMDIFESIHQPILLYSNKSQEQPLGYIKGKNICAVSALGDNGSFIKTLKNLGAHIGSEISYMDHHKYTAADLSAIFDSCAKNQIDTLVTTEKDWVKLKKLIAGPSADNIEILILKIKLRISNEEDFFGRLSSCISG